MSAPGSRNLLVIALIMVTAVTMIVAASDDNCGELCLAEPEGSVLSRPVSASEAFGLIQANEGNPDFIILDVRTSVEYASGHIEDSVSLDYYSPSFKDELVELDKGATYLIYCRSGRRSALTMAIMEDLGFLYVYDLSGGIEAWRGNGRPLAEPE